MELLYSSGNKTVDYMSSLQITGNVIPQIWYKTIIRENGKPNINAITVLSDIVYWYRPQEVRDEQTGHVIGLRKRFKSDLLQRNYQQIAEQFGLTKEQARSAVIALEELGVIRRELRKVVSHGQCLNNVMFIELFPEKLTEITYFQKKDCLSKVLTNETPAETETYRSKEEKDTGLQFKAETNTVNTTKINDSDYPILSYQEEEELFKLQIDYDAIRNDNPYNCDRLDDIVSMAVDVLTSTKKTIRVNKEERPSSVVKSKFRKLNMEHIKYVLGNFDNTTTEVRNMGAMLVTSLYNATLSMSSHYSAKVQHDLYGQNVS